MAISSISATNKATLSITAGTSADFASPTQTVSESNTLTITTASTGADAANQYWSDQRSLAGSASETLDVAGGLTNALGQTVTFTRIKWLYFRNRSTTAADTLTVGNAAANQWVGPFGAAAHTLTIRGGGHFLLGCNDATAYAVTAGSADNFKVLNNSTNAVSYDLILVGEE